jgi:peptide-methionine (S)-S-oxide reductase
MARIAIFILSLLFAVAPASAQPAQRRAQAVFAGGCFWCMESDFEHLPGVVSVVSGYTGGREANPTYEQVSSERTGHYESVRVTYDPGRVTYEQLLAHFWRNVDPTDAGGQFCDRGPSYRTAIFVTDAQRQAAEASKASTQTRLGRAIVTPILPLGRFWTAEQYHQDYYRRNPLRYRFYRTRCGRDGRLREVWGAQAGR